MIVSPAVLIDIATHPRPQQCYRWLSLDVGVVRAIFKPASFGPATCRPVQESTPKMPDGQTEPAPPRLVSGSRYTCMTHFTDATDAATVN